MTRSLGAGKREQAEHIVSIAFFTGIIMGLVITVLATFNIHRVILLLGATETIAPYAEAYAALYFIAAPFMICSFIMNNSAAFPGEGLLRNGRHYHRRSFKYCPGSSFYLFNGNGNSRRCFSYRTFSVYQFLYSFVDVQSSGSCISISIRNFQPKLAIYREIIYGGIPSLGRQGIASVATIPDEFYVPALW